MPEMPPEINASEPHPARICDYFLAMLPKHTLIARTKHKQMMYG
jgi:hypothetical protein